MTLTANEAVSRYVGETWNGSQVELIRELCADPIKRHDADKITPLAHDQQIARLKGVICRNDADDFDG